MLYLLCIYLILLILIFCFAMQRNDMVEYFGEQLSGFAFTANGWVQSYGSRCVKPPIIYGDVSRPKAMTVFWSSMAQSMTKRPMKGMLTGPVTILNWSFVRNDQPRWDRQSKWYYSAIQVFRWYFDIVHLCALKTRDMLSNCFGHQGWGWGPWESWHNCHSDWWGCTERGFTPKEVWACFLFGLGSSFLQDY